MLPAEPANLHKQGFKQSECKLDHTHESTVRH